MIDANQRWGVQEAIAWTKALANHNLLWIEEPTSPDDVLGHKAIAEVNLIKTFGSKNFYMMQNFRKLASSIASETNDLSSEQLGVLL